MTQLNNKHFVIMAGGTGGHVFPALAVANELRERGLGVSWLGTRRGLEAELVPKAGYEIDFINVTGLRGNGVVGWLLAPIKLIKALIQALQIIRQRQPDAVLGMGGFATGPGGIAAWLLRKPLVIHEQNAIAGLTNRLLTPFASRALEAFPDALHTGKAVHTGNPVRKDIKCADLEQKVKGQRLHILVVGGSLGAKALNDVVPQALQLIQGKPRPEVLHQTGKRLLDETLKTYKDCGVEARVLPFIDDMAEAYRWADLVVCRSGALTVAELAMAGLPSILVPYPFAVDDHQTANARYLADAGAALIVQQHALDPHGLLQLIESLTPQKLHGMAQRAAALALPDATSVVADQCVQAAGLATVGASL